MENQVDETVNEVQEQNTQPVQDTGAVEVEPGQAELGQIVEATNSSQDPAFDVRAELQAKHEELQTAAKSLLARFETYFAEIPQHFHQEIAALKAKL